MDKKITQRIYAKKWRETHPDYYKTCRYKDPDYAKKWREAHPDYNKEKLRNYKGYFHEYYQKHKEEFLERQRKRKDIKYICKVCNKEYGVNYKSLHEKRKWHLLQEKIQQLEGEKN